MCFDGIQRQLAVLWYDFGNERCTCIYRGTATLYQDLPRSTNTALKIKLTVIKFVLDLGGPSACFFQSFITINSRLCLRIVFLLKIRKLHL